MLFYSTNFSCIEIDGPDSRDFLQKQLSNDISALDLSDQSKKEAQLVQTSCYCDAKGRLISLLKICRKEDNHYFIIVPKSLISTVINRLKMFKLRASLNISDSSDQVTVSGYISEGPDSTQFFDDLTTEYFKFFENTKGKTQENCWIFTRPKDKNLIFSHLDKKAIKNNSLSAIEWDSSQIIEGIPWINDKTTGMFLPQNLNLDIANGISFKKGCYPGQEVIARMHYLGKPKKRTFLLQSHVLKKEVLFDLDIEQAQVSTNLNSETLILGQVVNYSYLTSDNENTKIIALCEMSLKNLSKAYMEKSDFYLLINDIEIGVDMMSLPYQDVLENELDLNSEK